MTDHNVPEIVPAAASDFGTRALMEHWKRQRERITAAVGSASGSSRAIAVSDTLALRVSEAAEVVDVAQAELKLAGQAPEAIVSLPELLIGALIEKGGKTDEGDIVLAVTPIFRRFLRELNRDPSALYHLDPRQFEELIAGAYEEEGSGDSVVLTPRSGDKGRDVIVTSKAFGTIRIIDQVKLYKPHLIVEADDVRAIYGVLALDQRASKAIITTTSTFAPGVYTEFAPVMPSRLSLRNGEQLRDWLFAKF